MIPSRPMLDPPAAPDLERLDRRVLRVCDAVGSFIEYWGFKAIHGRVWTLLALRGSPMSQAQLAEVLGVSRALMSGAVSELVHYGLVRPVGTGRKAPYEAVIDVWPTISDVLRSREWQLLDNARQSLESAVEEVQLRRAAGDAVPYDLGRMKLLLAMTEMAQRFLRMLISLRTISAGETLGKWIGKASALVRQRLSDFLAD